MKNKTIEEWLRTIQYYVIESFDDDGQPATIYLDEDVKKIMDEYGQQQYEKGYDECKNEGKQW